MNPFLVASLVALLDGTALGALDLVRVIDKFGWYGDRVDLIRLACFSAALGIGGALAILLPAALLLRTLPGVMARAKPWPLLHGIWFGANTGILFVWKRYAAIHEAGGSYTFAPGDLLPGLLLGLLAGAVFGPTLERLWRILGLVLRWPVRRLGTRRAGAGVAAAGFAALISLVGGGNPAPAAIGGMQAGEAARKAGGKNVVLVIVDAIRSDHVGLYGYAGGTTPQLDALASKGSLVASRYFSNSSYTLPSISSIFTSRNPAAHGVTSYGDVLRDDFTTLAEAFRSAGYETAAFSSTLLITPEFGFAQGFDTYRIFREYRGEFFYARILGALGILEYEKRAGAGLVTDRAIRWLEGRRDRPFFLVIFYADPHFEYKAPRQWIEKFADPDYLRVTNLDDFFVAYARGELRDDESLAFARSLYDAEIARVDDAIGVLSGALEDQGLAGNTVIAVTSDHGEQFFEHGSSRHGKSLYVEEIHCPLVIIDPAMENTAKVDAPARGIDIYPTLLDAAGVPVPKGLEGGSLLPLAGKGPGSVRESLMMVAKENYLLGYWVDPWLLLFDRERIESPADRGIELYNLARDPGAHDDLAGERPEVAARMGKALDARVKASRAAGPAPERPIAPERMELLRELHYVK